MISLCSFVKNEEHCVNRMISSVRAYVDELVIVDTGSTDNTIPQILSAYPEARIYKIGFTDFGSIRTVTAHLARREWVLMLDADEVLERPDLVWNLTADYRYSAYAFPRKRWRDLEMKEPTGMETYPDWQTRLFRNNHRFRWGGTVHEHLAGTPVQTVGDGIVIHHFADVYEQIPGRWEAKHELYQQLNKAPQ